MTRTDFADMNLTQTQSRVLDFIAWHIVERGFPPTRTEICQHFGYRSPNAAECHLRALARRGAITMTPKVSRGIRVMWAS